MGLLDKLMGKKSRLTKTPAIADVEEENHTDAKMSDTESSIASTLSINITYETRSGADEVKIAPSVPEEEKQYYQPDSYYHSNGVITFEERKSTSIPSENGLYVGEIMLLHYCSMGKYPHPKNGYPGFWWYNFGIRDVTSLLKTLEDRDFIRYGSIRDSVKQLKVTELKELLEKNGLPVAGKKDVLMKRVQESVPESDLVSIGLESKYILTSKGEYELSSNEYIPFLYKNGNDGAPSVWYINKIIANNKQNWKLVVENEWYKDSYEADKNARQSYPQQYEYQHSPQYRQMLRSVFDSKSNASDFEYETFEDYWKSFEDKIKESDNNYFRIKKMWDAEDAFDKDHDCDTYISILEKIWDDNEFPIHCMIYQMFKLPDMYLITKQFDKAYKTMDRLEKMGYSSRTHVYRAKIERMESNCHSST